MERKHIERPCILLLKLFLMSLGCHHAHADAQYPASPESDPPNQWKSMLQDFPRHCNPFGISVFAKGWPRDKFVHACNVLAQMLDNDQDGCADDERVVAYMRKNQAGMAMFPNERGEDYDLVPDTFNAQGLWKVETELGCSGKDETANCRDAALEEILHVITANGVSAAYPEAFSECPANVGDLSYLQEQMDIARGGHFKRVPNKYPADAIYHYYDKTCDYGCQATEFTYWVVTSFLDGQDARVDWNADEWEASTKSDLQQKLPDMYKLLADGGVTSMVLFSSDGVLPGAGGEGATATYNPSSQTCNGGCSLDGTGCGALGNKRNVDPCDNGGLEPTSSPVSQPSTATPTASPVSQPTAENCGDSILEMVWKRGTPRTCEWLAGRKNKKKLCKRKKVKSHCPKICDGCEKFGCSNSLMTFVIEDGATKKCSWVARRPEDRCGLPGVDTVCRGTCEYCGE